MFSFATISILVCLVGAYYISTNKLKCGDDPDIISKNIKRKTINNKTLETCFIANEKSERLIVFIHGFGGQVLSF